MKRASRRSMAQRRNDSRLVTATCSARRQIKCDRTIRFSAVYAEAARGYHLIHEPSAVAESGSARTCSCRIQREVIRIATLNGACRISSDRFASVARTMVCPEFSVVTRGMNNEARFTTQHGPAPERLAIRRRNELRNAPNEMRRGHSICCDLRRAECRDREQLCTCMLLVRSSARNDFGSRFVSGFDHSSSASRASGYAPQNSFASSPAVTLPARQDM